MVFILYSQKSSRNIFVASCYKPTIEIFCCNLTLWQWFIKLAWRVVAKTVWKWWGWPQLPSSSLSRVKKYLTHRPCSIWTEYGVPDGNIWGNWFIIIANTISRFKYYYPFNNLIQRVLFVDIFIALDYVQK